MCTVYIRYAFRWNLTHFLGQAPHFFNQNMDSEEKVPMKIGKETTKKTGLLNKCSPTDRMVKYKPFLTGAPYIHNPELTAGFDHGVGYFKNFLKHKPALTVGTLLYVVAQVGLIYVAYIDKNTDMDVRHKYRGAYTVGRKEELDLSKGVYN